MESIKDKLSVDLRVRGKKKIHKLFKLPPMTGIMRANSLQWLGHIKRTAEVIAQSMNSVACATIPRELQNNCTHELNDESVKQKPDLQSVRQMG